MDKAKTNDIIRAAIEIAKEEIKAYHPANEHIVNYLRMSLALLEYRAAEFKGKNLVLSDDEWKTIENQPVGENGFLLKGAGS